MGKQKMLYTLGHSTRPIEEVLEILRHYGIRRLIDVRTIPRSRYNPQFNQESFPQTLSAAGIDYLHMKDLGGLRRPSQDSLNTAWRNDSFRGYADYMQTEKFEKNIQSLIIHCQRQRSLILCAEAVPWKCHRSLIADALTVRGITVEHIVGIDKAETHRLTPFARVEGTKIIYDGLVKKDS